MAEMDNKQTDSPASEALRVNIFDQSYSLRSPKGAEHIKRIAQIVDDRMRQISAQTTTFDLLRVAILAALNIADELEALKARQEESDVPLSQVSRHSGSTEETAPKTEPHNLEPEGQQTWFDAIFDAEVPTKDRSERLSSQVSSRLKTIRQDEGRTLNILAQEENE